MILRQAKHQNDVMSEWSQSKIKVNGDHVRKINIFVAKIRGKHQIVNGTISSGHYCVYARSLDFYFSIKVKNVKVLPSLLTVLMSFCNVLCVF